MTLVQAAQAGPNAIIMAADSRGTYQDGSPAPAPVRKLFLRKACGIVTFGSGIDVPATIERELVPDAGLKEVLEFMADRFKSQGGVHSIVGGLVAGSSEIWHVNSGHSARLASPIGEPTKLWRNQDAGVTSEWLDAHDNHTRIIQQMRALFAARSIDPFVGPPFNFLIVTED